MLVLLLLGIETVEEDGTGGVWVHKGVRGLVVPVQERYRKHWVLISGLSGH